MELRLFVPGDLPSLYEICLRTGDAGRDASATCSHPRLLGDYFAAPYAERDPALCLVLADEAGPCGYVLGTTDTVEFARCFNAAWLPRLRDRYRELAPPAHANDGWLLELMRKDMSVPACAEAYPAHLHIDLLPRAQGRGWGRRMLHAWFGIAAARGATGVHLGVAAANTRAMSFYERVGMRRIEAPPGAVVFGMKLPVAR